MSDNVPALPNGGGDTFLLLIERAARDPGFDLVKFEALMAAREREIARLARIAFNEAMSRAQADMQGVTRDGKNNYLGNRYATLDAMLKVIWPAITPHGLGVRFGTATPTVPSRECITCTVHGHGHEETIAMEGPTQPTTGTRGGTTQMNELQAIGSTATYLKRYTLGMAFALVLADEQDDDGEATRPVRRDPPPTSTPPRDVPRDAPRQPQEGRTAGNGNGGAGNGDKWKASLQIALDACKSHAAVDGFVAGAQFVAWRAKASMEQELEIGRMIGLRRAQLTAEAAQAAANPPAPPAEGPRDEGLGEGPPTVPSEEELALRAEIAAMDLAALDRLPTSPEFNRRLMALDFPAQDRISAAIKTRAEALQGAKA